MLPKGNVYYSGFCWKAQVIKCTLFLVAKRGVMVLCVECVVRTGDKIGQLALLCASLQVQVQTMIFKHWQETMTTGLKIGGRMVTSGELNLTRPTKC